MSFRYCVDKIGSAATEFPNSSTRLLADNPAIKNRRGRATTNTICFLDNLDGISIVVSIPGFL
jgi:hypothetical protein